MPLNMISLPAEHHEKEGKRIPLCSRVARKNLGILLGIAPDRLSSYDV